MINFKLNLFWKFSIAIISIVLLFGSINAYLIWDNVHGALEREIQKRGLYIAKNIARNAVNLLLYEDYFALQKLMDTAVELDNSISYAFVMDDNKNVLIYSFENTIPKDLIKANPLPDNVQHQFKRIQPKNASKDEGIIDIAVPILNKKLGTVRIGLKEDSLNADVEYTIRIFWTVAVIFLLIGIIGAFIFAHFITSPIKKIIQIADKMDFDTLKERNLPEIKIREKILGRWKTVIRAEDEIDLLNDKFNDMILRLENAYVSLQKTQDKLVHSEKMVTVGTIAAGLAHEINNPIAGLQSCLRRLNKDPGNIEQTLKYYALMDEAVGRVEKVMQRMLNFSRKHDFTFKIVNLLELIEQSFMLLAYRLEEARITINKEVPANIPKVYGNASQLEQVFVNLLLNSIDAIIENDTKTDKGNRVISLKISRENSSLYIRFEDSGTGIEEENMERIFDPFFTTKKIGSGTGLGLAVCYNIIQTHNGNIKAVNNSGGGATFIIILPL